VLNFVPCSSYYIGSYKLPVISENECNGVVVCKTPSTPPGTATSYALGVLVEATPGHHDSLSFGPHGIVYDYRTVNINKMFSLLADELGYMGQGMSLSSEAFRVN
jgi:hypothetical protein